MAREQFEYPVSLGSVDLPSALFIEYEHDIVLVEYKDYNEEIDVDEAMNHTKALAALRNGKPCHIILDFLKSRVSFTNEARHYFAKNEMHTNLRLTQAIVVESLAHKLVANFYIKFNKPSCPTAIFNTRAGAFKWMLQMND